MNAPGFDAMGSDWFPVRITAVGAGPSYTFQEVWLDGTAIIADRIGGRINSTSDPAYAIDGNTFTVGAVGDPVQCLCRRGPGAAGTKWELKGSAGSESTFSQEIGVFVTPLMTVPLGTVVDAYTIAIPRAGNFQVWATLRANAAIQNVFGVSEISFQLVAGTTQLTRQLPLVSLFGNGNETPNYPLLWETPITTAVAYLTATAPTDVRVTCVRGDNGGGVNWTSAGVVVYGMGYHSI